MKQYRVIRKVASAPITTNGFATVDLPRDYDYEAIIFRIAADVTVSVGATAVRAEAPCQLVPRIEVIADGKNTLFSAPFWFASLGNVYRPLLESGARVTTPPSAATAADYSVEAIGVVDFQMIDGVRPKDTNFRSSQLSLFQARLTFGAAGDIFRGGTVAFKAATSPVVDVYVVQLVEAPDANGQFTTPIGLKKVSYQQIAMTSSNTALDSILPAGNLIKAVFLRTDGGTNAGEPSAQLNNVTLQNGVDVRLNLSGSQLRAKNNADYGQITTGYYIADVTSKGRAAINMTELWDVTQAAQPKVTVDETGGANVTMQVVVTEVILAQGG